MSTNNNARSERASLVSKHGSIKKAIESGELAQFQSLSLGEALILGLINQGVRIFVGVFGHGMTEIGEVLRIYEQMGLVRTVPVRSEIEASHAAAAMKWRFGETPAVFTSIGPGALQAIAASLTPLSNSLGMYYLMGDETTHSEGPNMQQIPRREQELFLRLAGTMGPAYSVHTPEAISTALKRGNHAVHTMGKQTPFYMLLPMNIQPASMEQFNLLELPERMQTQKPVAINGGALSNAARMLGESRRTCVKVGGGAAGIPSEKLLSFLELTDSVFVHGPNVPGLIPSSHQRNMTVGGSKGSISGNFAMAECDLIVIIGTRGVCQWDSSGTAFPRVENIININIDTEDLMQYNRAVRLHGDAETVLDGLIRELADSGARPERSESEWLRTCREKRAEWEAYKTSRFATPVVFDEKWQREILTQPAAINLAVEFADSIGALKIFDAGDVQANGFQIVHDEIPGRTMTDTGASYMGFAVSALLSSTFVDNPEYPIAFTGDGSFMMNPQVLIDAANLKLKGMVILFDNRRMAAISSLQRDQYGYDYKTDDQVVVDYSKLASSIDGVQGYRIDDSPEGLQDVLARAYQYEGLSLVHVPVYFGDHKMGNLGSFGDWNVGPWCDDVQRRKHSIGL